MFISNARLEELIKNAKRQGEQEGFTRGFTMGINYNAILGMQILDNAIQRVKARLNPRDDELPNPEDVIEAWEEIIKEGK